jgi:hypothetical protein
MLSLSVPPDIRKRPLVERALDVAGIPKAFRPDPLRAEEMAGFYSESLDKRRANHLRRQIKDDLLESAEQGFFSRESSTETEAPGSPLRSTGCWTSRRSKTDSSLSAWMRSTN